MANLSILISWKSLYLLPKDFNSKVVNPFIEKHTQCVFVFMKRFFLEILKVNDPFSTLMLNV